MHKPLRDWTVEYLEQIEDSERTHLEFKASEVIKQLSKIGDVVSAFANYDGGHIILGVKDRHVFKVEPDGGIDLQYKHDLKSWLEDKVPHVTDPAVRNLDVRTFQMATGAIAVIEIRESDDAPHQDRETRCYYGRTGSKCTPLSHRQVMDIIQRHKSPVLEISPIEIESVTDPESGSFEAITFRLKNVSKTVCNSCYLQVELPTNVDERPYIFPDERQPEFNGIQRIYTDTLSGKFSHVVEIESGKIYPQQEKIMAFRGFECRINGAVPPTYLSGRKTVKITPYADPPPDHRGRNRNAANQKEEAWAFTPLGVTVALPTPPTYSKPT